MTETALALPEPVARRGISEAVWRTARNAIFPGAKAESVLMAFDYCAARRLDLLKRPIHLVAMEVRIAGTDKTEWRDVPIPGIYELRTTAQRTGLYLGHSKPEYGPQIDVKGVRAPEWVAMTFYRLHAATGQRIEFPVQTLFREVVATNRDGKPNARWARAPVQMATKCCEAAGLREAFPDEFGGLMTAEELDGQRAIDVTPITATEDGAGDEPALTMPDGYQDWLADLTAVADTGLDAFAATWKDSPPANRGYLTATEPEAYEQLKAKAAGVGADDPA